jgi:hypothetical protein
MTHSAKLYPDLIQYAEHPYGGWGNIPPNYWNYSTEAEPHYGLMWNRTTGTSEVIIKLNDVDLPPAPALILSCILYMNGQTYVSASAPRTAKAAQITSSWSEGTHAPLVSFDASSWKTANSSFPKETGDGAWHGAWRYIDLGIDMLTDWKDNPDINYGILIRQTVTTAYQDIAIHYNVSSSTPPEASVPPYIDIVYMLPPEAVDAPEISGLPIVGETLTTTTGSWLEEVDGYYYQWQRNGTTDIAGATSSSYTLTDSDVGNTINVVVTAYNDAGSTDSQSADTTEIDMRGTHLQLPIADGRIHVNGYVALKEQSEEPSADILENGKVYVDAADGYLYYKYETNDPIDISSKAYLMALGTFFDNVLADRSSTIVIDSNGNIVVRRD